MTILIEPTWLKEPTFIGEMLAEYLDHGESEVIFSHHNREERGIRIGEFVFVGKYIYVDVFDWPIVTADAGGLLDLIRQLAMTARYGEMPAEYHDREGRYRTQIRYVEAGAIFQASSCCEDRKYGCAYLGSCKAPERVRSTPQGFVALKVIRRMTDRPPCDNHRCGANKSGACEYHAVDRDYVSCHNDMAKRVATVL